MSRHLVILTFHRVLPAPDPLRSDVTAPVFDRLCATLARYFNVLPLAEGARRLQNGELPPRAVCLTFDDGYADNAAIATPLLARHGLKATFFVATGYLDGGIMFNDRVVEALARTNRHAVDLDDLGLGQRPLDTAQARTGLVRELLEALKYLSPDERLARADRLCGDLGVTPPRDLMMTSEQVRSLIRAGMEVGGHTVGHPILSAVPPAQAAREIAVCRGRLEEITGTAIHSFAYPNGRPGRDYEACHVEAVADAGYEQAVSTAWGCARREDDPLQLPRITTWDRRGLTLALRLLRYHFAAPRGDRVERSPEARQRSAA
jgi:peptidoglycan/xylan/chitin deacetylase (PgdA/CDA1 family)